MAARTVNSKIEQNGRSVRNILAGMALIRERAERMLAQKGITDLQDDRWYPLQSVLDTLYAIQAEIGTNTLRAIGRKVPDNSAFPPEIQTLEQALGSLDAAYKMNHRGPGYIGGYRYTSTGPQSCRMVVDTPFPCAFDMGLLEALGERFRPKDSLWVRVGHDPKTCRERGDASCAYTLSW